MRTLRIILAVLYLAGAATACEKDLSRVAPLLPYPPGTVFRVNTSNKNKQAEMKRLFESHGMKVEFTDKDLAEIDADSLSVIVQKASQFPSEAGSLVEDTSFDVEGLNVGVNVRWLMDTLPQHVGKRATFRVKMGVRVNGKVHVYTGTILGTIVASRGTGFGFDPFFQPDGETQTLAEAKPDRVNARALAIQQLVRNLPDAVADPIENWTGPWQHE